MLDGAPGARVDRVRVTHAVVLEEIAVVARSGESPVTQFDDRLKTLPVEIGHRGVRSLHANPPRLPQLGSTADDLAADFY